MRFKQKITKHKQNNLKDTYQKNICTNTIAFGSLTSADNDSGRFCTFKIL